MSAPGPVRVLWIAPNLNHYKRRFLARLDENPQITIRVLAGRTDTQAGHHDGDEQDGLRVERTAVTKRHFGYHPKAISGAFRIIRGGRFSAVLVPAERKHYPLIIWLALLRLIWRFKLVTYAHPIVTSIPRKTPSGRDLQQSRRMFGWFDLVVFYSEHSMHRALAAGLVPPGRASFANNTLDTAEIWQHAGTRPVQPRDGLRLMFIGRLQASKRLDLLFEYVTALRKRAPALALTIIGDGPLAARVSAFSKSHSWVTWEGAVVDEARIAGLMRDVHSVLVPGWSGLSIVHAFAYAKPYMTCDQVHPPEIDYLRDGENGLILSGDLDKDVGRMHALLTDPVKLGAMSAAALATAQAISVENWCAQMAAALLNACVEPGKKTK